MLTVKLPSGVTVKVQTLKEASELVCKSRDELNLGASCFYETEGVGVIFEGYAFKGKVAYNGRIFKDNQELDLETGKVIRTWNFG